jgi:hypothetical protein
MVAPIPVRPILRLSSQVIDTARLAAHGPSPVLVPMPAPPPCLSAQTSIAVTGPAGGPEEDDGPGLQFDAYEKLSGEVLDERARPQA